MDADSSCDKSISLENGSSDSGARASGVLSPSRRKTSRLADKYGVVAAVFLKSPLTALLALSLTVIATYWNSLSNGYVLDDSSFILTNPLLNKSNYLWKAFFLGDNVGTGIPYQVEYYRPLTMISFSLNSLFFGDNLVAKHLTSVLLHLMTSVALYFVVRKLARPWVAFLGAMLFVVHPVNVEAVSYISARADLLCGFFTLSAFYFYLRYSESGRIRDITASIILFIAGCFSKEPALMLPAAIAVHMTLEGKLRERWRTLPFYALSALLYLTLRFLTVSNIYWENAGLCKRLATAGVNIATTVQSLILPLNHQVYYPNALRASFFDPDVLTSWLLIGIFLLCAFALRKTVKTAAFGIFWFLIMMLPVCGVVTLLEPTYVADRYMYLPLTGLLIAFIGLAEATARSRNWNNLIRPAVAAITVAILIFGVNSTLRAEVWESNLSFWTQAAKDDPSNPTVLTNYAAANMWEGNSDIADSAFRQALVLDDKNFWAYTYYALHNAKLGNFDEALRYNGIAMQLSPDNWMILNNQGEIYYLAGEADKAIKLFKKSIKLNPLNTYAKNYLSQISDISSTGHLEE